MEIYFIGGIHGAGKGTICKKICQKTNLTHLIASDILKWEEISTKDNKNVLDIQDTQDRLLVGLKDKTVDGSSYLLDGHYCLFNGKGEVEKIPLETFRIIKPKLVAIVEENIEVIKQRLENRDNRKYEYVLLDDMQNIEKRYAKYIAKRLKVPFFEIKENRINELIEFILKQ